MTTAALLELRSVSKSFDRGRLTALDNVNLDVRSGETVGIIGSSGAGKSTLARVVAGLVAPDAGAILFDGEDVARLSSAGRRAYRRRLHLVFQDPYTSLAGHLRVADLVAEPLVIHRAASRAGRAELVAEALTAVQLPPERYLSRWPHQLSGGERQRVALARALVLRPRLVVADEPTAMLDPRVRAELLDLMGELQGNLGMAYLFITHDLAVAAMICSRLVVMSRGAVVEEGPTGSVVGQPRHPATTALVDAARRLQGSVPA
ncbi:MAG: dipeptide/oligopeptide/nickel ABC transporter ATP-binding protein [Actinomycetota bacterium]|nr:dipeptide/oligopeptide/nickel ABC transporter ATP-binding protein [Actinomycetota bacterium]